MSKAKDQLVKMLALQGEMNSKVNPTWIEKREPFLRAVVMEAAELMDHIDSWKWWKKGNPDLPQAHLEIVDIWHFMLSHYILRQGENAADKILAEVTETSVGFNGEIHHFTTLDINSSIELLIGMATIRDTHAGLFSHILNLCELTWDELYRQYIGKNVLNFFRQDHGYKSGEYIKTWDGAEDNVHLVRILNSLDASSETFKDDVYTELAKTYASIKQ